MNNLKHCQGCGVLLQDENVLQEGYTTSLENDICQRCFRMKNYGEYQVVTKSNDEYLNILKSIGETKDLVLYVTDLLNLEKNIEDIRKIIPNKMILVLNKKDVLPKSVKETKLIKYLEDKDIHFEEVIVISANKNYNIDYLLKRIKYHQTSKNVYVVGHTNAGKSSLINALMGSKITVSNKSNTTQDFIKIKGNYSTIYDAPGFISKNTLPNIYSKNELVPFVYQMDPKYFLRFNNVELYFKESSNITMYLNKQIIAKLKVKDDIKTDILVPSNSDLVIKGIGFIRFKSASFIGINLNPDYYEIRPTIIGGNHE